MTMITIQKLPSLEPEMRGALRKHIMRKRQRLKQEMEQDAIEKRLKKEREQKRIQDAMTLDQIKEQLSTLEKRLESLRNEKHDLFVQLKQVLNEGSSKRKQSDTAIETPSDQQKKPKLEDEAGSNATTSSGPSEVLIKNENVSLGSKQQPNAIVELDQGSKQDRFVPPEKPQELVRPKIQSPKQIPILSPRSQTMTVPSSDSRLTSNTIGPLGRSGPMMGMSPLMNHNQINSRQYKYPDPRAGLQAHEALPPMIPTSGAIGPQNLAALQAQFRTSMSGDVLQSIPHELLLMSQRLNPNFQKLPPLGPQKFPLNPMSLPRGLSQHELLNGGKSLGLSLNQQQGEEMFPGLSKGHGPGIAGSSFPGHTNQFFLDNGLPPHLAHLNLLNHGLPLAGLDPSTSIASSMAGLGPNLANFNPRAPLANQLSRASLDYLGAGGQQGRPNLLLPGLNSLYPPHSSPSIQQPSASIYPGADFNHPLFQASLAHRMGGPMTPFNLTPQQQQQQTQLEQASRIFANNQATIHRRSSPKSQFYPGR